MRKKPFLSRYEESRVKSTQELTWATESGENSDEDEYYLDGTILTENIETSDEDDYYTDTTIFTRALEADDEDYYSIGSFVTRDSISDSDINDYILD